MVIENVGPKFSGDRRTSDRDLGAIFLEAVTEAMILH